ncbi:glycoside hydrolase family 18 protein [Parathielavia hyrcaniae]|uniref:chitinase n=1 Tax=Parathielavia hyrcaniae TaxID=113614 RepID=A0AAN6T628_9PEZI|nr:glycoside hydrolase family 18 protein [Parathielavia hyrcaniae]
MLSSLVLLVAPFALVPAAVALPANAELGPGEDVQVQCEGTTVTTAIWLTATSATQQATGSSPVTLTASASSTAPSTNTTVPLASGYRSALYFTNWGDYGANFQPQQLPGDKITHVLYAFADIAPDGTKHYPGDSWNDVGLNAYGCVKQLYLLKKKQRHVKTHLSIGGWTYSPKFAPVAATEAGRQRFCDSSVTLLKAQDYVLLLQTCRQALDAYAARHAPGHHFLLTIASPAGPQNYQTMQLEAMDGLLDAWHMMAYDYAGSWDATTGHQSNLRPDPSNPAATKFSTERAVADYVARGIPAAKIVLSMPLYGRAFKNTRGLGQTYAGVGPGSIQAGVYLYRDLPRPGAGELYDEVAGTSYSFDEARGELVSYDNVLSARKKAEYLVQRGLGGAVFWEAAGDKTGDGSLVSALAGGMGELEAAENWLAYPDSRYANVKNGMSGA